MTTQERVLSKVSKELGIPLKVVEPVFVSQFKLVVDTMAKGESKAVSLPKFGTFSVKPKRQEKLENSIKKYKDGQQHSDIEEEV